MKKSKSLTLSLKCQKKSIIKRKYKNDASFLPY